MIKKRIGLVVSILSLVALVLIILFISKGGVTGNVVESYNLEVEVPSEYSTVLPGTKVWFTTKILNLASVGRVDVVLEYRLFDLDKNLLASRSETVAIETQASFVGNLEIPSNLAYGDYVLEVEMISESGGGALGSTSLSVGPGEQKSFFEKNLYWVIILVLLF